MKTEPVSFDLELRFRLGYSLSRFQTSIFRTLHDGLAYTMTDLLDT